MVLNLFNRAGKENLDEHHSEGMSVFANMEFEREVNPKLLQLKPRANKEFYGTCVTQNVKNYLSFMLTISSKQLYELLQVRGKDYSQHNLQQRWVKVHESYKYNRLAYGANKFNVNPIIDMKFMRYENLILVTIDFLYEQISEYYDNEEFNKGAEEYQFNREMEANSLLLHPSFQFHPDLCLENNVLNPYRWGAFAPIENLPTFFVDWVQAVR